MVKCYGLNVCAPPVPEIIYGSPNLQCDAVRWGFCEVTRFTWCHESGAFMMGLALLINYCLRMASHAIYINLKLAIFLSLDCSLSILFSCLFFLTLWRLIGSGRTSLGFVSLDIKQSCRSLISWSCLNVPQFSMRSCHHSLWSWFNKNLVLIPVTFSGASFVTSRGGINGPEAISHGIDVFDSALSCWRGGRGWPLSLQDPSVCLLCTPWNLSLYLCTRPIFAPQRILGHYCHPALGGSKWIF